MSRVWNWKSQVWLISFGGSTFRVCVCVCVCLHAYASLLSSPVATESPYTHTTTPDPAVSPSAYSLPQWGQIHPPHTHNPLQTLHPFTAFTPTHLPFKRDPEIAQEAIRKNTATGGGSCRGLQSKAIQGYTPTSPSLSYSLSPLVLHPSPSLSLPLFVLMNQCFSEHAHYGFDS